ncbi:MAG TPA: hypothetical protein VF601_13830 [Beijerinckiaceae bacterium]|jgi:hypothetical protein
MRRPRCKRARAGLALAGALLASPAPAQQGEPIGSWWLLAMPGGTARHAIMTLSTQGSGVVGFRCEGARSTVLLGLNRPEARPRAGSTVALEWQIGAGPRRRTEGALTSGETVELDEAASRTIIAEAAEAASFSFHLPQGAAAEPVTLVFRPVETKAAVERMRQACRR